MQGPAERAVILAREAGSMIVLIMGVEGAGKTTVGRLLAQRLGWEFADGDDFHPRQNKEKLHKGIPLTDADREPWLEAIHEAMLGWVAEKRNVALACSALKEKYRAALDVGPDMRVVYLKGSYELIAERLRKRTGHFVSPSLLASQFETLEEPADAVVVDASAAPEEIVESIELRLGSEQSLNRKERKE
jgi:gluconokinase